MRRHLWLALLAATAAQSAAAQQTDDGSAAELRRSFQNVSSWVTKAAEQVPADQYGYRPVSTVRTFGQLIAHIADSYNYYCAFTAGQSVEWSDAIEQSDTDKATVMRHLEQARDSCLAAYAGDGEPGALIDNVAHTSLHYGNVITYMRMLGLVPPST